MSLYSASALAEAAGITVRQVQYWTDQGWLTPVHIEGSAVTGSGNRRIYDTGQVNKAGLIAKFTDTATAARIADALCRDTQFSIEGRLLGWVKR